MSTRFEKLVKLSGTNLTYSVYPMITYVQVTSSHFQQCSEQSAFLVDTARISCGLVVNAVSHVGNTGSVPQLLTCTRKPHFIASSGLYKVKKWHLFWLHCFEVAQYFSCNKTSLWAVLLISKSSTHCDGFLFLILLLKW